MQRARRIVAILFLLTAAGARLPGAARANVQYVVGLSPKGIAMGNAFSAIADDFSAAYFNPAGLAQIDYHQFYLGYMYSEPFLTYESNNPYTTGFKDKILFKAPVLGLCLDLTRAVNVQGHELVLGIACTIADNLKKTWQVIEYNPEVPRFLLDGDYMNRVHLYASLGFEVFSDVLYVGAGLNVWQDISAEFDPRLNVDLSRIWQAGRNIGNMILIDENRSSASMTGTFEIAPIAGILFKPASWLSLAYTYRKGWEFASTVQMNNYLELTLAGVTVKLPDSFVIAAPLPLTAYFLPWNMTGGLAIRPVPGLLVSADLTYYHWSSFEQPLFPAPEEHSGWQDTWVPSVGAQLQIIENLYGRVGYSHQPSPVGNQYRVASNFLSMTKNIFSLGLGYTFSKFLFLGELPLRRPIQIDGFFQWQQMDDRIQVKRPNEETWRGGTFWHISGYQYSLGIGVTTGY